MAFPNIQTAAAHLEREQSAKAIPVLEQLVDSFPSYSMAYLLLARARRMEGNREAALQALAQVQFWSSTPPAVEKELRAIVEEQLEPVGEPSEDPGTVHSSSGQFAPPSTSLPEEPVNRAPSPARRQPDELAEDLRERLGPPSETTDEDIKDLDSLIQRLEGARIQPEPEFGSADQVDDADEDETDGEDEVVSETLARIYAAQKEYKAAVETYRELAEQHPDRADEFLEQARELENKRPT